MQSGFLIINKPKGITSFDVIRHLRKITGVKKIGHAGTLDPMASGVLVCAIGREATKKISKFLKSDKEYAAKIKLGEKSDTYDAEGKIRKIAFIKKPNLSDIENILNKFIGITKQTPPIFSAKKIKGKRAYEIARSGGKVVLNPVSVKIDSIKILSYKWPYLKIKISCGPGTYIRSLANDIGRGLKVGGYLVELKRTKVGDANIKKARELEGINENNWEKYLINIK